VTAPARSPTDWFDRPPPADAGLRFACTMCGNCCSGPEGYVLVDDDEAAALAARLGVPVAAFLRDYTHMTEEGRSLNEKRTGHGLDCVFLDRDTVSGKAICGVYEDRPVQCRTWPFWPSVVKSQPAWERARRTCPGMDKGKLHPPQQIRIMRDSLKI
jgi:Fe-S-cluster containining protein